MRKNNRILKILSVNFPSISFISNSGEYRIINIKTLFKKIGLRKGDFGYEVLENKELFNSVTLIDKAIAWVTVKKKAILPNKDKFEIFFHLDPINTILHSEVDVLNSQSINYGRAIKMLRKYYLNISQEELGEKIGTDKQYISKVENYKTDLELKTLRKIYEVGLNKKILIAHYDQVDPINSFTNSVLTMKFIKWANREKSNIELIEGIGSSTKKFLCTYNIITTEDLAEVKFPSLIELVNKRKSISSLNPDTWLTQAKLITNSDWIGAIKLQRTISNKDNNTYSKIEALAKKDIKEEIYHI